MSYYGGFSKSFSCKRKFRLGLSHSCEDLLQPLVEEGAVSNFIEMKSYGGLVTGKYPANSTSLGYRLNRRRDLIQRRRWIVDVLCLLALLGIILMVINTELFVLKISDEESLTSWFLKLSISASTVVLLVGICYYYYTCLSIKALDAGVKDCVSVVTNWTVVSLVMELLVCALHPFPGNTTVTHVSPTGHQKQVSIDAVLSILMMSRLYLVAKFAVVHSPLVADTSTNSIGALSKIKINSMFVFKAAMTTSPGTLLLVVMLTTFLVNSWAMRTCEMYYNEKDENSSYAEVMWLISTTFLTVGYGDMIPRSYCGRYISICTGCMGVGTTALLVAVLARKLEQTRLERYVFNMVSRVQIEKRRKAAAANVIKAVFHIWMLRKYSEGKDEELALKRRYEDALKTSLRQLHVAQQEMAHVGEQNVGIIEVSESVARINDGVERILNINAADATRSSTIETRLTTIEGLLTDIRTALSAKKQ